MAGSDDARADGLLGRLRELDRQRRNDPFAGRRADEAMIELCQFVASHRATLSDAERKRILDTLRALNLRPYWSYCREHMMDVGLEF